MKKGANLDYEIRSSFAILRRIHDHPYLFIRRLVHSHGCSTLVRELRCLPPIPSALVRIWIPSTVRIIGHSAFFRCSAFASLSFESPATLHSIEEQALSTSGLCLTFFPQSIETIGKSCFHYANGISFVLFAPGAILRRISRWAFSHSTIAILLVPRSVWVLERECFLSCASLRSIIFESESELQTIEERVFSESAMENLALPRRLHSIDGSAFHGTRLTVETISIESGLAAFVLREGILQTADLSDLVRWFGAGAAVCISHSVACIGRGCFAHWSSLKSVSLTEALQLQRIEKEAFKSTSLQQLWIPKSVAFIGDECFAMTHSLHSVTFECESRIQIIGAHAFLGTAVTSIDIHLADGSHLTVEYPESAILPHGFTVSDVNK
jgi:hypothetical protein